MLHVGGLADFHHKLLERTAALGLHSFVLDIVEKYKSWITHEIEFEGGLEQCKVERILEKDHRACGKIRLPVHGQFVPPALRVITA